MDKPLYPQSLIAAYVANPKDESLWNEIDVIQDQIDANAAEWKAYWEDWHCHAPR